MNLTDDLHASATRDPDKALLIHKGNHLSYREIEQRARAIASGLHKLGIRKGDRVAFSIGNLPEFVTVHYGILLNGAISVPLNTQLKAAELRPYLASVSARAIIAHESVVNEVMAAGPHSAPVFVIGSHPTARSFDEIPSEVDFDSPEVDAGDVALLAYTSGTAGSPKGATLTHGNLAANVDQMLEIREARTQPTDVILGILPLFHIYGLNVVLHLSVRQGATVALEERFDPMATLRTVVDDQVTVLVGAPPIYTAWLNLPATGQFDLSRVRFAVSGASALAPEVIEGFRTRYGVEIWEGYGLTEAAPVVATTRMAEQRPGSIGKPLAGVEVRIVDPSGNDVVLGDPGEIWVRGANVFRGYWGDDEATQRALSGSWFMTGDLAYQDEDGYLWLVDREKELIIVSGFNVYPSEVEEALLTHAAVADAAVIGLPDSRQGEKVKAFVVLKPGQRAGEDELIVHCTSRLARFKVPSEIEFREELPRLPTGKIVKRLLSQ